MIQVILAPVRLFRRDDPLVKCKELFKK